MFCVLIWIVVVGTLAESSNERRFVDQVNSVRRELSYAISDISTLFKNVENINKTIWSKYKENGQPFENDDKYSKTVMTHKKNDCEMTLKTCATMLQAFESEKRLNRELQIRLNVLEKRIVSEENRSKKLENGHSDLQKELETEKQLRKQVSTNLEKKIKSEENRLNELEDRQIGLKKKLEDEKQIRKQVQKDVEKIKDSVSAIYKEVGENITSLLEQNDCMSGGDGSTGRPIETTADISRITSPEYEDEREITTTPTILTDCVGVTRSGLFKRFISSLETEKNVFCDVDNDRGNWIVTMRRQDGSVNFTRSWDDYKNGFGNVSGEFWIGNEALHALTKSGPRELRIDMEDFDGIKKFAKYETFQIGSEADKYKLSVSGHSGTVKDALIDLSGEGFGRHNGMKFSTIDTGTFCAVSYLGGWWYDNCFQALLTGPYSHAGDIKQWQGIIWLPWTGGSKSLKFVEMKLR